MREELHQMVDQLPENEVQPALELIRGRVAQQVAAAAQTPISASAQIIQRNAKYYGHDSEPRMRPSYCAA